MFKWIKKKISQNINSEMDGCIIQNYNFIHMVQAKRFALHEDVDDDIFDNLLKILYSTEQIDKSKKPGDNFTPKENDILLEANKYCRNVWTNYFKQSAFSFDKEFPTNKLNVDKKETQVF